MKAGLYIVLTERQIDVFRRDRLGLVLVVQSCWGWITVKPIPLLCRFERSGQGRVALFITGQFGSVKSFSCASLYEGPWHWDF